LAIFLALLLLFLVSVPVDFILQFHSSRRPPFYFLIGWLFGLFKFDIRKKKKKSPNHNKPEQKKPQGKSQFKIRYVGVLAKQLPFRILRLAEDIFHSLHFKTIEIDLKAGLGEPADTGRAWGMVYPLLTLTPYSRLKKIRLIPDFSDEPVLEGDACVYIRLWPIEIILAALKFVFSRPVLQTLKKVILLKWRNRS